MRLFYVVASYLLIGTSRVVISFSLNNKDHRQGHADVVSSSISPPVADSIETAANRESFQELRQTWPLWLQHGLRDTGALRFIVDVSTRTIMAPNFYKENPKCFPEFCRISGYPIWLTTVMRKTINVRKEEDSEFNRVDFKVEKYGSHPQQFAEVMIENSRGNDSNVPLVVFVHGGAWGSGFPSMYRLTALPFLQKGYRVAILGYRLYPQASVEGQANDVSRGIRYISETYNARKTVVIGHSSGAHISLLASLQGKFPASVIGLVGMSGVYDIEQHYGYESLRGVDQISPMKPACGTTPVNMRIRSPRWIVTSMEEKTTAATLPSLLLIHGVEDDTALSRESIGMQEALSNKFEKSELVLLEDVGHADTVLQLTLGGKSQDTILEWLNHLQTNQ